MFAGVQCTTTGFASSNDMQELFGSTSGAVGNKRRHHQPRKPSPGPQDDFLQHYGQQVLFPDLSFNCSGLLTEWIFAASYRGGPSRNALPELHVWRRSSVNSEVYGLVHSTTAEFDTESHTMYTLYNDSLLVPLPIEAGDILGIYQPSERKSRLSIVYSRSGARTRNYYKESNTHLDTISVNAIGVRNLLSAFFSRDQLATQAVMGLAPTEPWTGIF